MNNFKITKIGNVITINSDGFRIMVMSDIHFDSPFSNRKLFFHDLDFAAKNKAKVFVIGDFFDAMQGRFDPRRDMSQLRPEYRRADYYDYIVEDAAKLLKPYRSLFSLITPGNHEAATLKNANTDLIGRLTKKMSTPGHTVHTGGYGGIIRLIEGKKIVPVKYFHGSGGEAPVTRGAIQTSRQAVFLPDFQIVLNGHSHHAYWIPIVRERVNPSGDHYFDIQHHVRTPGYNMSYGDGSGGWEVTRGGVPKPMGSFMLDINDGFVIPTPLINIPIPVGGINDVFQGTIFPQE